MTKTYALIPVKEFEHAKARLAPVLDGAARRELALAMFRDVLAAAKSCAALDGVAVVSRDQRAREIATAAGAEGMAEAGGLNEALSSAAATKLREQGVERLVVLVADLPLADAGSIAALVTRDADVAVVPSRDGGTNALVLTPGAIEFQFGPDSARQHLAAAEAAGLRAARVDLPRLALDIDQPADLDSLRAMGSSIGRHTHEALERMGLLAPRAKR
jgi:2-phospho-L-lactate guanylyltransferase